MEGTMFSVPQYHHLSERKFVRIQEPVIGVFPEQAFDRNLLGSLPVMGGKCGRVHHLYVVWKGSCANREGGNDLDVVVWDRRGAGS